MVGKYYEKFGLKYPVSCHLSNDLLRMLTGAHAAMCSQDPFKKQNFIIAPADLWMDESRETLLMHEFGHLATGEKSDPLLNCQYFLDESALSKELARTMLKPCNPHNDIWADDEVNAVDHEAAKAMINNRLLNVLKYIEDRQILTLLRQAEHAITLAKTIAEVSRYGFSEEFKGLLNSVKKGLKDILPEEWYADIVKLEEFFNRCPKLTMNGPDDVTMYEKRLNELLRILKMPLEVNAIATGNEDLPH